MTIPATGLVVDRQPEILERIVAAQKSLIDANINTDPSTVLGQITTIFSTELARVAALVQDIYDSKSLSTASDIALDDLVSLLGVRRQAAQPSSGEQYFRCTTLNQIIPATSQVSSVSNGKKYALEDSVAVSPNACREVNISILTNTPDTTYEVNVNGDTYIYSVVGTGTDAGILAGINSLIVSAAPIDYSSNITDNKLKIVTSAFTDLAITIDTKLRYNDITVAGNVVGLAIGSVIQAPNTVASIRTPVGGWVQTYNPQSFAEGREKETDDELRVRALLQNTSGKATSDAIRAALLAVDGVTYASVLERYVSEGTNTLTLQPEGSIECVVVGGVDDDIAQSIWDTKAAGVETFGTTTNSNAVDDSGASRTIKFSRTSVIPIYMTVTFDLFDDEDFPSPTSNGIAAIKAAILAYGNNIGVGIDVDYKRFYGAIYSSVSGISNVVVKISDADLTSVAEANVVIGANEISSFSDDITRLTVSINP